MDRVFAATVLALTAVGIPLAHLLAGLPGDTAIVFAVMGAILGLAPLLPSMGDWRRGGRR